MLTIALIGLIVGLVMGVTGAGGGIIATPALIYALGWDMQHVTPIALLAVTTGAAFGAMHGLRNRQVRYRAALLMAAIGMPFTLAGTQLAHVLPQRWLLGAFALVLLIVASRLFRQQQGLEQVSKDSVLAWISDQTGRFEWSPRTAFAISAIGSVAGFTAGLLGVGGGFIIVPMLRRFTNASMHVAIATSLLVISLVGLAGIGSALAHGAVIPATLSITFVSATLAGVIAGRYVTQYLSTHVVQKTFASLLIVVAGYLIFKVAN
jgi:uncharacterized protein